MARRVKRKAPVLMALTPEQRSSRKPYRTVYEKNFEYWLALGGEKRQYLTIAQVENMRLDYEVVIITTADDHRVRGTDY